MILLKNGATCNYRAGSVYKYYFEILITFYLL